MYCFVFGRLLSFKHIKAHKFTLFLIYMHNAGILKKNVSHELLLPNIFSTSDFSKQIFYNEVSHLHVHGSLTLMLT